MSLTGPPRGELAARGAREWLLALVASRPLASVELIPVSALAREGPGVCDAVLQAIESDAELEWLTATGDGEGVAARARSLAGCEDAAATVEAIECLRAGVLAALGGLPLAEDAALAVGDRLAHVCARLAAAAVTGPVAEAAPGVGPSEAGAEAPTRLRPEAAPPAFSAVGADAEASPRPLWMAALERQLAEGGRSGRRFVLALVDLDGADRLRLAAGAGNDVLSSVGRAIRQEVRRADLLAHEDDGRLWVIAPDAGRAGGTALASRLAATVQRAGTLRGAPLTVSVGIAVYPDDGRDAVALTEQAEEQMFVARAAGTTVTAADPEEPAAG